MTPQKVAARETVELEDLKDLAAASGPCISVAVTVPDPLQIRTRIRNGIRDLQNRMKSAGIGDSNAEMLAGPIRTLAESAEASGRWGDQLLIYRSPSVFRYFSVWNPAQEFVDVADRFQIRPLLPVVSREQRFFLLALSQNYVRLFRCTHYHMEPVELRGYFPESLEAWMNAGTPDHVLDNRASGGPSVGSMKGVMFGTTTDRERRDEYLHHFFKEVDEGLHRALRGETAPMLLVGVEEETAIYRHVNTYSGLMEDPVHGSPDGMTAPDLHRRAIEIIRRTFAAPLRKLLHDFEEHRGNQRVTLDAAAVVKAAHEGRVSGLLLRDDAEYRGSWDEASDSVQPGDEDLLTGAALMTLRNGGQAFSLQPSDLPEGVALAAALLRY